LTLPEQTQPYLQSQRTSWFDMRRRGVWIVAFFVAFIIIMAIGASMPVSPADANSTYNQLKNEVKYTGTVDFIFGHNFFLTLIMFTPFVGPFFGAFSSFSTGFGIEIIAIAKNTSTGLLFGYLFLFPHTWLELFTYSLAMSQSVFLSAALVKGRFRQELVRTCVIMAVCALILFLAAFLEVIL
jgi:hypothetical protein